MVQLPSLPVDVRPAPAQQLTEAHSGLSREPLQRLVVRCTRGIKPAEEGRQLDGGPEVQLRPSPGSGDRASGGVVTEKAVFLGQGGVGELAAVETCGSRTRKVR